MAMFTGSEALIFICVLLISVSVHEMMHAAASYFLGDDTAALSGRISLNPLRHIDPFFVCSSTSVNLYYNWLASGGGQTSPS